MNGFHGGASKCRGSYITLADGHKLVSLFVTGYGTWKKGDNVIATIPDGFGTGMYQYANTWGSIHIQNNQIIFTANSDQNTDTQIGAATFTYFV